jgi:hypothetical protein
MMTTSSQSFQLVDGNLNTITSDAHSGQTVQSSHADAAVGGSTASGDAVSDFNLVRSKTISVGTEAVNPQLVTFADARWDDNVFITRTGVPVTSGKIQVVVSADGTIVNDNAVAGEMFLTAVVGGGGLGTRLLDPGVYDHVTISNTQNTIWSASQGAPIGVELFTQAFGGAGPSTASTDFYSTGRIESVALLGNDGLPDLSVKITSSSGVAYRVSEPCGCALALAGLAIVLAWRRFRRF